MICERTKFSRIFVRRKDKDCKRKLIPVKMVYFFGSWTGTNLLLGKLFWSACCLGFFLSVCLLACLFLLTGWDRFDRGVKQSLVEFILGLYMCLQVSQWNSELYLSLTYVNFFKYKGKCFISFGRILTFFSCLVIVKCLSELQVSGNYTTPSFPHRLCEPSRF